MDEMMMMRLFGGGPFGSGIDLAAVLAFIAFGVVAFLVPVLGYPADRAGGITTALFLLVGYVAISVVQVLVQWVQMLDGSGFNFRGRDESWVHLLIALSLLKMILFLLAMLSFALGVRSLLVRRVNFND